MIRYALVCDQLHEFESWFSNSAAYDKQVRRGLIACPLCGSAKVEKALMRPRLARSESSSRRDGRKEPAGQEAPAQTASPGPAPVAMMTPQEQELRRKLRELRDHLVKNSENVGSRFPEEARRMHYGETEHRSIYGVASAQDAEALNEEGIAFSALPVLPDDRN
jgi:hypothetical protein